MREGWGEIVREARTEGAEGAFPAPVAATLRAKSLSPSRASSPRRGWLGADHETPGCAAARVRLLFLATAGKA